MSEPKFKLNQKVINEYGSECRIIKILEHKSRIDKTKSHFEYRLQYQELIDAGIEGHTVLKWEASLKSIDTQPDQKGGEK
jgi:hypothetical protein